MTIERQHADGTDMRKKRPRMSRLMRESDPVHAAKVEACDALLLKSCGRAPPADGQTAAAPLQPDATTALGAQLHDAMRDRG